MLIAVLAFQWRGIAKMLRDGDGATTGDKGHEKRGADVAGLGELLAPADVVVAVSVHERMRQMISSWPPFPFHILTKEDAPGVTREVEPVAVIAVVDLQLCREIHEPVLSNRQVPVKANVKQSGGDCTCTAGLLLTRRYPCHCPTMQP